MEDFLLTTVQISGERENSLLNRKMIFRILGILLTMEAMLFLVCMGVSLYYQEADYIYFVYSALLNAGVGGLLILGGRNAKNIVTRRDGYCVVAFTWLLFTAFGMLRCPDSRQQELRCSTILNRFLMECFSGAVSRIGSEGWESFSSRLSYCRFSEWATRCCSRLRLRA